MLAKLEGIQEEAMASLAEVKDEETLEGWRVTHLGRSSALMNVFDQLGQLPREERPEIGRRANQVKQTLEAAFEEKAESLRQAALARNLQAERLDISLPGRPLPLGRLHPITQTMRELYRVFGEMGFQVYRSRDVETDEYNFQLLNFPPYHPAREMQDSYYIAGDWEEENPVLLRTH
ncbi:MAG TPA: phenylalanine--tRNA ligase subunit alpha, partial [Anaerolineales bacterium]|nr:phenylalanine--tRNA ligase subunit alpha [Anaerolineales bacterium]